MRMDENYKMSGDVGKAPQQDQNLITDIESMQGVFQAASGVTKGPEDGKEGEVVVPECVPELRKLWVTVRSRPQRCVCTCTALQPYACSHVHEAITS